MPTFTPDIKYFEPQQIESVIESANTLRDKALIAVIYNCGLRRGEVQFLVRDDYNHQRGLLKVTRLKKLDGYWHEIPLWQRTRKVLNAYLRQRNDHADALFLSQKGGPLQPHGVYHIFRGAAERAGLQLRERADGRGNRHPSPHRLRHSLAVHMTNCGIPIEDTQEQLAHASINTTMIYARVTGPRKLRNAMVMQASHHFAKF